MPAGSNPGIADQLRNAGAVITKGVNLAVTAGSSADAANGRLDDAASIRLDDGPASARTRRSSGGRSARRVTPGLVAAMTSDPSLAEFLTRNSGQKDFVATSSPYSDRACSAEETFRRIEPCLAAHGITRLGRLTGLDKVGIPVWQAVSPNARSIVINNGKGITDLDAKVSAAMEALERTVAGAPAVKTVNRHSSAIDGRRTSRRSAALADCQGAGRYCR